MKKVNYLILLFLGMTNFLFASTPFSIGIEDKIERPPISAQNWYNEMHNNSQLEEGCVYTGARPKDESAPPAGYVKVKATVKFYVRANQTLADALAEHPDMFLRYKFTKANGEVVSTGITGPFRDQNENPDHGTINEGLADVRETIYFEGSNSELVTNIINITSYSVYIWARDYSVHVGSYTGDFSFAYDLLTDTDVEGEYTDYPICDYAGPEELFDGCIFEDTYEVSDCFDYSHPIWVKACTDASWEGTKVLCNDTNPFPTENEKDEKRFIQNGSVAGQHKILISPNPFNEDISIKTNIAFNEETYQVAVFDVSGKKIWSKIYQSESNTDTEVKIHTSDWSPGIYFIQLATSLGTEVKQMVKVY